MSPLFYLDMKTFIKYIFFSVSLLLPVSCTVVTSTNLPGKQSKKTPSSMLGKYALELSEDLKLFMGEDYRMTIHFMKKRITVNDGYNDSDLKLNDSVFISKIKKDLYLSLGAAPNYTVMKVKKYGPDLYLFPMYLESEGEASDISAYFTSATDVPGEVDENGEMGFPSISVTIDDSKLSSFFSSQHCISDSFRLKRIPVDK